MKKEIVNAWSPDRPYETKVVYVMEEWEMVEILPLLERSVNKRVSSLQKKVAYYDGLRYLEATEKQLDRFDNYTEKLSFFENIANSIDKIKKG